MITRTSFLAGAVWLLAVSAVPAFARADDDYDVLRRIFAERNIHVTTDLRQLLNAFRLMDLVTTCYASPHYLFTDAEHNLATDKWLQITDEIQPYSTGVKDIDDLHKREGAYSVMNEKAQYANRYEPIIDVSCRKFYHLLTTYGGQYSPDETPGR